jgi:hypothetical protein
MVVLSGCGRSGDWNVGVSSCVLKSSDTGKNKGGIIVGFSRSGERHAIERGRICWYWRVVEEEAPKTLLGFVPY